MIDVIQIAAEFLKIDPMLVQEYMQQGPVHAIFFLFFFPTVFLILFVWILVSNRATGRADLDLLITVAIYAFILMSGYYTFFVWLSKWWLYLMLLLGIWYLVIHYRSSSRRGQSVESWGTAEAWGEGKRSGRSNAFHIITGGKFNADIRKLEDEIDAVMKALRISVNGLRGDNTVDAFRTVSENIHRAQELLSEYENALSIAGGNIRHRKVAEKARKLRKLIIEAEKASQAAENRIKKAA